MIDLQELKKIDSDMVGHIDRIYEAARGAKQILEIGVRSGMSTRVLLKVVEETGGILCSVDTDDCSQVIPPEHREHWIFIQEDSQKLTLPAGIDSFDVLFIDGDHEIADKDFLRFEPLVRKGGKIIMHDTIVWPLIGLFVSNLDKEKYDVVHYPDCYGLAVIVKLTGANNEKKRGISPNQYVSKFISEHGVHPEVAAMIPYAHGSGIDIGCGGSKTVPNAIGVDLTPKGKKGQWGNQKGETSEADVCASGDCLPFKNDLFDFIIARHNLEHYQDIIKTLLEWHRVLKVGGYLCVVVPDDAERDTIRLDPTHKHVFTRESLQRLIEILSGFKIVKTEVCIPHWSLVSISKKKYGGRYEAPDY